MQVRFADQDRSGGFQAAHHLGVFRGNPFVEDGAGGGGPHAGRVDVVLECDRDAVQRAAEFSGRLLGLKLPGLLQRVIPHHRDERVQLGIVDLDPGEARFHQLLWRDAAGSNARRRLGKGQVRQVVQALGAQGHCSEH